MPKSKSRRPKSVVAQFYEAFQQEASRYDLAQAERRSRAAKKGWRTRRANSKEPTKRVGRLQETGPHPAGEGKEKREIIFLKQYLTGAKTEAGQRYWTQTRLRAVAARLLERAQQLGSSTPSTVYDAAIIFQIAQATTDSTKRPVWDSREALRSTGWKSYPDARGRIFAWIEAYGSYQESTKWRELDKSRKPRRPGDANHGYQLPVKGKFFYRARIIGFQAEVMSPEGKTFNLARLYMRSDFEPPRPTKAKRR